MCVSIFVPQANRALRANHNLKVQQKAGRNGIQTAGVPLSSNQAFGRANRPQTPVNGIINNAYGDEEDAQLQLRYAAWKQAQRATSKGVSGIRMTNAQIHADNAVRAKNQIVEPRPQFKLKRFQDVNPRTSTKRGENAFMVQSKTARPAQEAPAESSQ